MLIEICPVAPDITLGPNDVETLEGTSATFLCAATGRPRPTITWYKTVNDSNIQECVNVSIARVTVSENEIGDKELMSNLTLSNLLPSDATDYFCAAQNAINAVMSNATLIVNGK